MTETTYSVAGMTCDHCARAVSTEVSNIPGVSAVTVDVPTGTVRVTSEQPVDEAVFRAAVEEAGYEVRA
ncbi:MAG TPA: heavy-metal-associated domain-containing protein [Acidimicrobiales bacterium]|nr:heavy-metal-associated domain-containing protein [Acidimicrobiales bacterium]